MSRVCEVTGKGPMAGHNVSHAKNHTKRRFLPNLQKHRFYIPSENRYITLRLSTQGIRNIDKLGIEVVLARMAARDKDTRHKHDTSK